MANATIGRNLHCYVTYRGFVWEKRRGFTLESRFIDDLVAEWETTSVDFKRQLSLDTMDHKAEFIKDVLSLANTKAGDLFVRYGSQVEKPTEAELLVLLEEGDHEYGMLYGNVRVSTLT